MTIAPAPDRPLQARSVATRTALLDAALESLVERGYAATTTIETARRAGVSRGAQLHHFPTEGAARDRRGASTCWSGAWPSSARCSPRSIRTADRLDAAVDLSWSMFQGPAFAAWLELWIAARTDPELAAVVVAMDVRFTDESRAMFLELFPPDAGGDPRSSTSGATSRSRS